VLKDNTKLRSRAWFGGTGRNNFIHRSWLKNQGHPEDMFDGRPVIGICNTWSELTPCNGHLRIVAERVKRGVLRSRRLSAGISGDVTRRGAYAADNDAVSQSRIDGR